MKLAQMTRQRQRDGSKALVPFLTACYPDESTFVELVQAADAAGCDAIEIGIPFSDPIADGPLIQQSSTQALDNGATLARVMGITRDLRDSVRAPLLFMGYYNPILRMGVRTFAEQAARSGVSGVIIPDMSLEESPAVRSDFQFFDICYVDLIAPNSSDERVAAIARQADGFLYLVSVTGVTGVRSPQEQDLESFVARTRKRTALPLYVGFGISDAGAARGAVRHADGVIIGSALIRLVEGASSRRGAVQAVKTFLADVKKAITATHHARPTGRGPQA